MSSVVHAHESGDQVFLDRDSWFSNEACRILEDACNNPKLGPDRILSVILHCGLGLPLELVARLQNTTKPTVTKRVIKAKRLMAKRARDEAARTASATA